jgi:hypothetical protein
VGDVASAEARLAEVYVAAVAAEVYAAAVAAEARAAAVAAEARVAAVAAVDIDKIILRGGSNQINF